MYYVLKPKLVLNNVCKLQLSRFHASEASNVRNMSKFHFNNDFNWKLYLRYLKYGLGSGVCIAAAVSVDKYRLNWLLKSNHSYIYPIDVNALEIPPENHEKKSTSPRAYFNFLADVVEKTAAAVVYIEIIAINPYTRKTVAVSNGSGFIVKADGLILTNAHVVHHHGKVSVKLQDGRTFSAVVESVDSDSDLATIRIQAENLPTLCLGDSSTLRPGEFVVAMGNPLTLSNSVTSGVVSSTNRPGSILGLHPKTEYIQTDAAINVGNSGGPLINLDGEVVGINTVKASEGISFAVPSDRAKEFLRISERNKDKSNLFKNTEKKKHKFLGITMLSLTPVIVKDLQERNPDFPSVEHGVLVWRVMISSPSYELGIRAGDVITTVNNKDIHDASDVKALLKTENKLCITVLRGQRQFEVIVPLLDTVIS